MSVENPLWGAPRIHGELLKLGFEVAQSSVAKYMVKRRGPPSQGWRTFLRNHAPDIAAMDLFVVPTIGFDLLYAFVIVRLGRRDLVWTNVTANPTAEWVARQITQAFPWDEAPHHLIRDRDRIYGSVVTRRLRAMGIRDKPTAPASPWQNGVVERLIGSIRRKCVDHIIVLGEVHLRQILQSYACYYNDIRTHRSLDARSGPWRPGFPVEGDHRFRWMTTTCSGRWRPGQQGCGRADERRWVIRESAGLRSFFERTGDGPTEITHAQDPRRAAAVGRRPVQAADCRQPPPRRHRRHCHLTTAQHRSSVIYRTEQSYCEDRSQYASATN